MKNRAGGGVDNRLKQRVIQYLSTQEGEYVDITNVALEMQRLHRMDYGRRNKIAFRIQVEKVHAVICNESGLTDLENKHLAKRARHSRKDAGEGSSVSDDSSDSEEDIPENMPTNQMNTSLMSLYRKGIPENPSSPRGESSAADSPAATPRATPNNAGTLVSAGGWFIDKGHGPELIDLCEEEGEGRTGAAGQQKDTDVSMLEPEKTPKKRGLTKARRRKAAESKGKDGDIEASIMSKKAKTKGPELQASTVTFADVGGNDATLTEVCKLLIHMRHPEVYQKLGVVPPRGFLLHGPPGCGKTLLAQAVAGEMDLPLLKVSAPELVSGVSGESEQKLRDLFEQAVTNSPCIMFIDEIDAITPRREVASKDMERRIVAQLLTCMDDLNALAVTTQVLVIGATNRPDSLDPALRRAGRFDREICLGIPDEEARLRILKTLCRKLKLPEDFGFRQLARLTPGYVGADLMALCREAAMSAVNRVLLETQQQAQSPGLVSMEVDEAGGPQGEKALAPGLQEAGGPQGEKTLAPAPGLQEAGGPQGEMAPAPGLQEAGGPQGENTLSPAPGLQEAGGPQGENTLAPDLQEAVADMEESCTALTIPDVLSQADASLGKEEPAEGELSRLLALLKSSESLTEEQLAGLCILMSDFESSLASVQPSAKREGFATVPDVTWADVGALHDIREELTMAILAPVRSPEQFKALGLSAPAGVLLAGPPGCGKTLLAKAVANESGLNFISVKGPELLNMYVGESERAVRQVFQRGQNSAPCVIFFDEIDALCPRRSGHESGASVRVVNQLLTEMDGLETRRQVFIMAATNRPDIIDPAVLRPGRLDKTLYVGLPPPADRYAILLTITKGGTRPHLEQNLSLEEIAHDERCDCFTGADLSALVREASVNALRAHLLTHPSPSFSGHTFSKGSVGDIRVTKENFEDAFKKVRPSVSKKDQRMYELLRESLTR